MWLSAPLKGLRVGELLAILALLTLIALFLGRYLNSPVVLMVISGRSMEPTFSMGDVVLGLKGGFSVGDVVVWCSTYSYCVIHRVVSLEGGTVITKGDNNPLSDPPVPADLVKYKVVGYVPREVWVPAAAVPVATYAFLRRREILQIIAAGRNSHIIFISYLILAIVVIASTPFYLGRDLPPVTVPSLYLRDLSLLPNTTLVFEYRTVATGLEGVEECWAVLEGGNETLRCELTSVEGNRLVIKLPEGRVGRLAASTEPNFRVKFELRIREGVVLAEHLLRFGTRELGLSIRNCTVVIHNPNYYPVDAELTHLWADVPGKFNEVSWELQIPSNSSTIVRLETHKYSYVVLRYVLGGVEREVRLRVRGCEGS